MAVGMQLDTIEADSVGALIALYWALALQTHLPVYACFWHLMQHELSIVEK